MKFGIGQPVRRVEDLRLITGRGVYTDDVVVPDTAQAFVLRAQMAHANIKRIDATAARRMPGVFLVATGEDLQKDGVGNLPCVIPLNNRDGTPRQDTPRPVLAVGKVRHVGQPVALVVAETLAAARDAAEAIEIDYEQLPAVTDAKDAIAPGAPKLFDHIPGNLVFDWDNDMGDAAATDAAFAKAARVVTLDLVNNRVVANSMEPRNALAEYDTASDRSTLYSGNARPAFRPRSARRHGAQDRQGQAARDHAQCRRRLRHEGVRLSRACAGRSGRAASSSAPVKWQEDRSEGFVSDNQGRDHHTHAELALDLRGRFLGLRVSVVANIGAYLSPFGCFVPTRSTDLVSGLYAFGAIHVNVKGVCHQHGAGLRLSRRRPAGSRLSARASGRRRGARNRLKSRQDPPHQFRAAVGDALHVADQAGARFRRVREGDGSLHGSGGVVVVQEAARARASAKACCAASAWRPIPSAAAAAFPKPPRSSSRTIASNW